MMADENADATTPSSPMLHGQERCRPNTGTSDPRQSRRQLEDRLTLLFYMALVALCGVMVEACLIYRLHTIRAPCTELDKPTSPTPTPTPPQYKVRKDPPRDHGNELIPVSWRMENGYHTIPDDGLYLLGGEVTLKSASPDNITITIRKQRDEEDKWEPILVGHIDSGSFSTGFMGRILLLEGGCNISMHSTHNATLKNVNNLSSFVIYRLVREDPPRDHGHELIPVSWRMENGYQTISDDGLYLLGGEVTLKSASPDNIIITIRKRSDKEDKWEPILVGHIASGSFSTGFMGRILLLEGGCHISVHSTHNARLKKVNDNLSSLVIYRLGKNPTP